MHLLFILHRGKLSAVMMGEVYHGFVNKVILHSFLLIVMALGFCPQCVTGQLEYLLIRVVHAFFFLTTSVLIQWQLGGCYDGLDSYELPIEALGYEWRLIRERFKY